MSWVLRGLDVPVELVAAQVVGGKQVPDPAGAVERRPQPRTWLAPGFTRVAADRGPLPTRSRLQIERPELVDADDHLWLILARLRLAVGDRLEPLGQRDAKHASAPLRRVRAGELRVRTFTTNSRPASGRPPAALGRQERSPGARPLTCRDRPRSRRRTQRRGAVASMSQSGRRGSRTAPQLTSAARYRQSSRSRP